MKEVILPKVQPGDVMDCVVANLVPFGAFVHVAGPDGRLHGAQVWVFPHVYLYRYDSTPLLPLLPSLGTLGARVCTITESHTSTVVYSGPPPLTRMHMRLG